MVCADGTLQLDKFVGQEEVELLTIFHKISHENMQNFYCDEILLVFHLSILILVMIVSSIMINCYSVTDYVNNMQGRKRC